MAETTSLEMTPISAANLKEVINRCPHDLTINAATNEVTWYTGANRNYVQLKTGGDIVVDGVKIESTSVGYQVSNSGTTVPTGEWLTDVPSVPKGKYLWSRMATTYTDGSITYFYSVSYMGTDGSGGSSGTAAGVVSIDHYYLVSDQNSGITLTNSNWSTNMRTPTTTYPYLWSYTVTNYSDGTSIKSSPVIIGVAGPAGSKGLDGVNGKSIYGICNSSGTSSSKVVQLQDVDSFSWDVGVTITVYFTNANTSGDPTLIIQYYNGSNWVTTGNSYSIMAMGSTLAGNSPYNWYDKATAQFTYDGTAWIMSTTSATDIIRQWCQNNDGTVITGENGVKYAFHGKNLATGTVTATSIDTEDLFGVTLVGSGSLEFRPESQASSTKVDEFGIRCTYKTSSSSDESSSDSTYEDVDTGDYGIKFTNVKTGAGNLVGFNANGNAHVKRIYCSSIRSSRNGRGSIYLGTDVRMTPSGTTKTFGDDNTHHCGLFSDDEEKYYRGYFSSVYISDPAKNASSYGPLYLSGYGHIGYKTSSKRYKTDIQYDNFDEELDPHRLYELKPVQYRYLPEYDEEGGHRYQRHQLGFIAEDVDETYPIAASYRDGLVDSYQDTFLIPGMMALIQEQHSEIEELKARVAALEGSNDG